MLLNRLVFLWILLVFASTAFAQTMEADREARLARTMQRYAAHDWPESPARQGLTLEKIRFSGFERSALDFTPGLPITLDFADAEGTPRFVVELQVAERTADARKALVAHLTYITSLNDVPTTKSRGIAAGDIGYIGYSFEQRISWIAFVRGNIYARISCLDPRANPHPDMVRLAETLDRIIRDEPVQKRGAKSAAPTIDRLQPESATLRAGQKTVLDLAVRCADKRSVAAVEWVVGGPGQGYVEKDEEGVWHLFTTRAGSIDLSCHVLADNGLTVSESVKVSVVEE